MRQSWSILSSFSIPIVEFTFVDVFIDEHIVIMYRAAYLQNTQIWHGRDTNLKKEEQPISVNRKQPYSL